MRTWLAVAVVMLALPIAVVRAGTTSATGPQIGAHALLGQEDGRATAPALSAPLATRTGSTLLAFVAGYRSNESTPRDNHGNTWVPLGPAVVYRGYDTRFSVRPWIAVERGGGELLRVEIAKPGDPAGELTLSVIEVRNGRLVDTAQGYGEAGWHLRSGAVRSAGPALLLAYWWGDGDSLRHRVRALGDFNVVDAFTTLPPNSAVQAVVVARDVDRAGSYSVDWLNQPRQGAPLWIFAFAAAQ